MSTIESHDEHTLGEAERMSDPPATCDHCRSVVAHASELTEVAADRYVCDDCQRDNAEPFSCDGCGLSVPEFLITNTTYIGSDCSMCPDCIERAD